MTNDSSDNGNSAKKQYVAEQVRRSKDTNHRCHATGCERIVPPAHFMCATHWRMVPKPLQRNIWSHYRVGQEVDKRPSEAYINAAKLAIDHVARLSNRAYA